MEQLIQLLKESNIQIPKTLFLNYKKLNINDSELILLIYLLNNKTNIYNPKKISEELSIKLKDVLEGINNLSEKGIVSIEVIKKDGICSEIIKLDLLYEKLAFTLINDKKDESINNIFDKFESELGRTLSPMEYEIINSWKENNITEETIVLALKEAIYNGVSNFRYIDKIIYEWNKKGIKTKEDVENNRKQFKSNKQNKEIFDYDWLNDEDNN